jgi:citronellol/citronellal dehydrogenase
MIPGVDPNLCRTPEILADAALAILSQDGSNPANTGNFFIDEAVLRTAGRTEFDHYAVKPGTKHFLPDLFLD